MTELEKATKLFSKDIFATQTTGIKILEVDDKYAKCSLKIENRHLNATGHVMGGAIFTLADFVFAVSTNFNQDLTVTTVSNISFLSPPKGDTLFAESKLIKDGRSVCFYQINVTDNLDNTVAILTTTGTHVNK